jgi:hypothetical protein
MQREIPERKCRLNQPKDIYTRVKIIGKIELPKHKRIFQNRNKLSRAAIFLKRELKFIFYKQVKNKKEIIEGTFPPFLEQLNECGPSVPSCVYFITVIPRSVSLE